MKDYVLHKLDRNLYRALLLCLSYENIYTYYEEIQKEPLIMDSKGKIILDQLLVTGNGENRFVAIPYEFGVIDFTKAENIKVDIGIRQLSVELLNASISSLQNTILTESQREMVQNNIAI